MRSAYLAVAVVAAVVGARWPAGVIANANATPTATATPTWTPTSTATATSNSTATSNAIEASSAVAREAGTATASRPAPGGADLDDPLELLWSHRIRLSPGGGPLVTVRVAEGQGEITFRSRSRARLLPRGGPPVEVPAGESFRVHVESSTPAAIATLPLLGEAKLGERSRLSATRRHWTEQGVSVGERWSGAAYGAGGRVIDTRRALLVAEGQGSAGRGAASGGGALPEPFAEVRARPTGTLAVFDAEGNRVASADALVTVEPGSGAGVVVLGVEHDAGSAAHGFEDRAYPGQLHLTLDAGGRLAAVVEAPLEDLLRGLVPSEIPSRSPREALAAQAVTARSNVLAQLGTRHRGDPYLLCAEVHCQAYRGEGARTAATDAAVRATAGEALFGRSGGRELVDAVYSAMCGGHGEDNDAVWPVLPEASLRGRPDMPPGVARELWGGLASEDRLRPFLRASPPAWCGRASGAPRDRFRWERRFSPAELDEALSSLAVGRTLELGITRRGISGRARALTVTGDRGKAVVGGELRIRKLLRNLPSAMFVIDREGDATVLRGGGWGHGVGMCQWGAIGRAEAGQSHGEILAAYYGGAELSRAY